MKETEQESAALGEADRHGNRVARDGLDRCVCGCKYWEHDRCTDCNTQLAAYFGYFGYE